MHYVIATVFDVKDKLVVIASPVFKDFYYAQTEAIMIESRYPGLNTLEIVSVN